jgi:hypothetical protein
MTVTRRTETYYRPECAMCEQIAKDEEYWDADIIARLRDLDSDFDEEDDAEWAMRRHNEDWHS